MNLVIAVANEAHLPYAETICSLINQAARECKTGIAKRKPEYIRHKISEGKAVLALDGKELAGFCYIESWDNKKYVANSGLIVHPNYRKSGLAKDIKQRTFELSQELYPQARIFGITTSLAVMKINSQLGYQPVTFSELTKDEAFWNGCKGCVNYDILQRTARSMCLCTGMVASPKNRERDPEVQNQNSWNGFLHFLNNRKQRAKSRFKDSALIKKLLKS